MMRAAIYARVSTQLQADTGYGLDAQVDACKRYADAQGYSVVGVWKDAISGTTSERPALDQLLDTIREQSVHVVVMHEADRLARDFVEYITIKGLFKNAGVRIEFARGINVDDDEDGEMIERVLASLADRERKRIVRKMRDGIIEKVKQGEVFSAKPPYGYNLVSAPDAQNPKKKRNYFDINEDESRAVKLIFQWYTTGDENGLCSVGDIVRNLKALGIPSRNDVVQEYKPKAERYVWTRRMVNKILTSETYIGDWYFAKTRSVKFKQLSKEKQEDIRKLRRVEPKDDERLQIATPREQWVKVAIPAIIDRDTFELAQQRAIETNSTLNAIHARSIICSPVGYAAHVAANQCWGASRIISYTCIKKTLPKRAQPAPSQPTANRLLMKRSGNGL
ncbi:MAG: recombinase family protein [Blastochloris sp.]|nr:recombinase family protein [Blastochloris sp.]